MRRRDYTAFAFAEENMSSRESLRYSRLSAIHSPPPPARTKTESRRRLRAHIMVTLASTAHLTPAAATAVATAAYRSPRRRRRRAFYAWSPAPKVEGGCLRCGDGRTFDIEACAYFHIIFISGITHARPRAIDSLCRGFKIILFPSSIAL